MTEQSSCSAKDDSSPCDCKTRRASSRLDPSDDDESNSPNHSLPPYCPANVDSDNDEHAAAADPWTYSGERLQALEFPLGGFGTGQILFQGDGTLQGWTITNTFHNPEYSPLYKLPGNLFGIQASLEGEPPQSYVLQTSQNYSPENCRKHWREESHVSPAQVRRLQELPGVPSLTAKCQYPIATIDYDMPKGFPLEVQMECMTPLIPGNTKDSSLPIAVFSFTLKNTSDTKTAQACLLQTTLNLLGWDGKSSVDDRTNSEFWESNINTPLYKNSTSCGCGGGYAGWSMSSQNPSLEVSRQGSLTLIAVQPASGDVSSWKPGLLVSDQKSEAYMWQNFCQGKMLDPSTYRSPTEPSPRGHTYIGGVTQSLTIPPKSTRTCQFVLTWFFPNRPSYSDRPNLPSPILGNFYQNWFDSAEDVARDVVPRMDDLVETTRKYVHILYASTIPWELLESAAGRVSVLRSPSMFWTRQGIVLGNEGNHCCPLNCSHVYGYCTLMERLFPEWAKNMLRSNFLLNFDNENGCSMRFGSGGFAIDGSLACVIKVYLVVRQADSKLEFLKQVWPNVRRQIEIVHEQFVKDDPDCVIRCLQQNTYDTAMQGANTFIGTYWIAALRVTAIMAQMMGDHDFAQECQENSEKAAKAYERICWREDFGYYVADVDETTCKNSYGTGCFIDQLCAVGLSLAAGLGTVLDPNHEAAARRSIFQYNRVAKPPFQDFQKHFYNGDKGVRVNTYPHGKLEGCYVYDDLVSTGFSYPVVAAMIYDGNIEMALEWARNIRDRHSGINRSPWNEPECGLFYVRAMAAWNLFDQACGFSYDSITGALSYAPKFAPNNFSCFLTIEGGWGQYRQKLDEQISTGQLTIECHHGCIELSSLSSQVLAISGLSPLLSVALDGKVVPRGIELEGTTIRFKGAISIPTGSVLTIDLLSDQEIHCYPTKVTTSKQERRMNPILVIACFLLVLVLWLYYNVPTGWLYVNPWRLVKR